MDSETDRLVADSRAMSQRIKDQYHPPVDDRRRRRAKTAIGKRLVRIAAADVAILVAAMVVGFVAPIGIFGFLLVIALLVAATLALAIFPIDAAPTSARLAQADIRALPARTERWLDAQRPALPAPAMTLVDQIGLRLDTLSPQLATIDNDAPVAADVRKLVGEQLPAFISDYAKVPAGLRTVPRNGKTPDAQLIDGLSLIERQIGEMTAQLAQGDLDSLATRGRFLEIKYKGDGEA